VLFTYLVTHTHTHIHKHTVKSPHAALHCKSCIPLVSCWCEAYLSSFCSSSLDDKDYVLPKSPTRSPSSLDDEKKEEEEAFVLHVCDTSNHNDMAVRIGGYLLKRKESRGSARELLRRIVTRSWKRHYFSLNGSRLQWGHSANNLERCIFLEKYHLSEDPVSYTSSISQIMSPRTKSHRNKEDTLSFSLIPNDPSMSVIVLLAENADERLAWIRCIQNSIENTQKLRKRMLSFILPTTEHRMKCFVLSKKFTSSMQWLNLEIAVVDSSLLLLYKTRLVAVSLNAVERCTNKDIVKFSERSHSVHVRCNSPPPPHTHTHALKQPMHFTDTRCII